MIEKISRQNPASITILILVLTVAMIPDFSLAQWTRLGGPTPPPVSHFLEHGGKLFMGTNFADQGDVFVSEDNGQTWSDLGKPNGGVSEMISHEGILFMAGYFSGLHLSHDNGQTWQPGGSMAASTVETLIPLDGQSYLAGLDDFFPRYMQRSDDGCQTWTEVTTGPQLRCYDLIEVSGVLLAGGEDSGVWRSTDGGVQWTQASVGLPEALDVHAFETRGNEVYLAGESFSASLSVYRSDDLGMTWNLVSVDLPPWAPQFIHQLEFIGSNLYLTINNTAGARGLYRSSNNGINWSYLTESVPGDPSAQAFIEVDGDLLVGTMDGVFRSDDQGLTWTASWQGAAGICGGQTAHWSEGRLLAGNDFGSKSEGGLQISSDFGEYWFPAEGPVENSTVMDFLDTDHGLYVSLYGMVRGVAVSHDGGLTFDAPGSGMGFAEVLNVLCETSESMLVASYDGLWRSVDQGQSWTLASNPGHIYALAYFDGWLYAGLYPGGVVRSDDDGLTWTSFSNGIGAGIFINDLEVHEGQLYVALNGDSILRLNGSVWEEVGFSGGRPYDLLSIEGGLAVCTASDGVWFSTTGDVWSLVSGDQDMGIIEGLAVTPDHLVAISRNRGFWTMPLSELPIVSAVETEVPAGRGLALQATPNPFNPQTTLSFTLPRAGSMELNIYDTRGYHVRRLVQGDLAAGTHQVLWDGRHDNGQSLATGVYLVEARFAGQGTVTKVVLVR
jgi:photosystem II stability/assembly factor-like uncharacterized protein|nr:FlgD immunoglobulin-like domain containing protein [Candidatus Krumholzibacteria bacterium]